MSKKRPEIWRIRDNSTGLYYTGGIYGQIKNPNYETDRTKRDRLRNEAERLSYEHRKEIDFWHGPHSWNYYHKERWNEIGKLFINRRGAEKTLSALTRTTKDIRATKAKNILYGNKKSNNYEIIGCKIFDIKVKEDGEKSS